MLYAMNQLSITLRGARMADPGLAAESHREYRTDYESRLIIATENRKNRIPS
jgi:hypothetical protein